MVLADLQEKLSASLEELTSQTYLNTYRVQPRSSLLKYVGLGTRANSIWKMAQYIIATNDDNVANVSIQQYLEGWKILVKNYKNQFLILLLLASYMKLHKLLVQLYALKLYLHLAKQDKT